MRTLLIEYRNRDKHPSLYTVPVTDGSMAVPLYIMHIIIITHTLALLIPTVASAAARLTADQNGRMHYFAVRPIVPSQL